MQEWNWRKKMNLLLVGSPRTHFQRRNSGAWGTSVVYGSSEQMEFWRARSFNPHPVAKSVWPDLLTWAYWGSKEFTNKIVRMVCRKGITICQIKQLKYPLCYLLSLSGCKILHLNTGVVLFIIPCKSNWAIPWWNSHYLHEAEVGKKTRRKQEENLKHTFCVPSVSLLLNIELVPRVSCLTHYTSSDWSSRSEPEPPEQYPLPRSGCGRKRWWFTSLLTPALDVSPVPAPPGIRPFLLMS